MHPGKMIRLFIFKIITFNSFFSYARNRIEVLYQKINSAGTKNRWTGIEESHPDQEKIQPETENIHLIEGLNLHGIPLVFLNENIQVILVNHSFYEFVKFGWKK